MATTIEELKEKLARVQQELAEVSAALDELATPPAETESVAPTVENRKVKLGGPKFTDPRTLLPLIDEAYRKMGIDITEPAMTPEEVQELMLREGVRPEDNLISRGIIEAREE
jgi:prefoldin subunit 5